MPEHPSNQEVEIKIRVRDAASARALLEAAGFRVRTPRTYECNQLFDTASTQLRQEGRLLRLRNYGGKEILTYKGPSVPGIHKQREELELSLSDSRTMEAILKRLGFRRTFRYEKYRTEYASDSGGVVTIDETPIGVFLEIEGEANWIDAKATVLGFGKRDYITASYGRLFSDYCREQGIEARDMEFSALGFPPEATK